MSTSITEAFIQHFGSDVHEAFQRQGSKLIGTVRTRDFAPGEKTRFFKVGKGEAVTKTRHGDIPPMNLDHSYVDCALEDYYAGDFIDEFDENKISIDERQAMVNAQAYACGRRQDSVIFDRAYLAAGSGGFAKYAASAAQSVDLALNLALTETFNAADVPDDGNRFWCVGPKTWSQLMLIPQFTDADFIGSNDLPFGMRATGIQAKRFNGLFCFLHSGVAVDGNGDERTLLYHKSVVGVGRQGEGLNPDWDWQGTKRAWFVSHGFTTGACVIDPTGTLEVVCDVT